jgi:hypothetical protein
MSEAFSRFGPLLVGLLSGLGGVFLAYRLSKKRHSPGAQSRFLLIGGLVAVLCMVVALVFFWLL